MYIPKFYNTNLKTGIILIKFILGIVVSIFPRSCPFPFFLIQLKKKKKQHSCYSFWKQ